MNKCLKVGEKSTIEECPYYSLSSGKYSFCNQQGLSMKQAAIFLNRSETWVRKQLKENHLKGWQVSNRWYFPRCGILLALYDRLMTLSSLFTNRKLLQDELQDCWRLKKNRSSA